MGVAAKHGPMLLPVNELSFVSQFIDHVHLGLWKQGY